MRLWIILLLVLATGALGRHGRTKQKVTNTGAKTSDVCHDEACCAAQFKSSIKGDLKWCDGESHVDPSGAGCRVTRRCSDASMQCSEKAHKCVPKRKGIDILRSATHGTVCLDDSECVDHDGTEFFCEILDVDTEEGTCQPLGLGDFCEVDGDCPVGFFCDPVAEECALIEEGDDCSDDSDCDDTLFCTPAKTCVEGACVVTGKIPCASASQCVETSDRCIPVPPAIRWVLIAIAGVIFLFILIALCFVFFRRARAAPVMVEAGRFSGHPSYDMHGSVPEYQHLNALRGNFKR